MFRKSGPPPPSAALTERVRKLGERKALPPGAEAQQVSSEGRQPRQPVYRNGALVFDDGQKLSVAIKSLSKGGARIEFYVKTSLPDEVVLVEPTLNLRARARVVWQREGVAGLEFME